MSTGFDLSHFTETSGFLDKPGNSKECAVIYDTKIQCASASARDSVLDKLAAVAKHAEEAEDGTYTFLVLKSLDNDDNIRIFERYATWEALNFHQSGIELVNLLVGSKEEIKSLEGRPYVPNLKGWLHRWKINKVQLTFIMFDEGVAPLA